MLAEQAGDGFDYSYIWRPLIAQHSQNTDHHSWLNLVSLVRDGILALAKPAPIVEHAKSPLVPSSQTQVCWALHDLSGYAARAFDALTPPLEWLEHFDRAGLLNAVPGAGPSKVCTPASTGQSRLSVPTATLVVWLTKHLGDRRLAEWVMEQGTCLHPWFRDRVREAFTQQPGAVPPGLRSFWMIVSSDISKAFRFSRHWYFTSA